MDNKLGLGLIIVVAVAIIVGAILFQAMAQQIGTATNTVDVANDSLGNAATNTTALYMTNYRSISGVEIYNVTGEGPVPATNYTVTNNVVYNGALAVEVQLNLDDGQGFTGYDLNISGTAQPTTYIDDSGARSIASLILIIIALAIGIIALTPSMRSGVLEMMRK